MRVCKLFFKLAREHRASILTYTLIFAFLFSISATRAQEGEVDYYTPKLRIYDHDDTAVTQHLSAYLFRHAQEAPAVPEEVSAQKEAVFRNKVDYLLTIPSGFTASMQNDPPLQLTTISKPYEIVRAAIDFRIESYLSAYASMRSFGVPEEAAFTFLDSVFSTSVKLQNAAGSTKGEAAVENMSYYFSFLDYVFAALLFAVIGYPIAVMEGKAIKQRDLLGSISETRRTAGTFFAVCLMGLTLWSVFILLSVALCGVDALQELRVQIGVLSNFVHLLALTALVLFLTHLLTDKNRISSFMTIFSLFIGFGTGIFIPRDIVATPLLAMTSVTPTYWDVANQSMLRDMGSSLDFSGIYRNIFVMLLLAGVYLVLTLIVRRLKARGEWTLLPWRTA